MLVKSIIVGIPRSNEDLFFKFEKDLFSLFKNDLVVVINTPDEFKRISDYLDYCKNSNSEYYLQEDLMDPNTGAATRINAFLKFKGIQNHYTSSGSYQAVVQLQDGARPQVFLFVPLYIRLKETKEFDQMKILETLPNGEIKALPVKEEWFIIEKVPKTRKRN